MRLFFLGLILSGFLLPGVLQADAVEDLRVLANADPASSPSKLVLNPKSIESRYRLAAGVSYLGMQVRYQFSSRYAAELRYQFGKADSNYGDVNAEVEGLRGYRFIPCRRNLAWYLGSEIAHAHAHVDGSGYETNGFALGVFGGLEYRVLPRVAIGMDIGPYVISLREKQSHLSQTNLDFVINTALNFYLF